MSLREDLGAALADADAHVLVVAGTKSAWGIPGQVPAEVLTEGGHRGVEAVDRWVLVERAAFPTLKQGDAIEVDGIMYKVRLLAPGPDYNGLMTTVYLTAP